MNEMKKGRMEKGTDGDESFVFRGRTMYLRGGARGTPRDGQGKASKKKKHNEK